MNIDDSKSYATETGLELALEKIGVKKMPNGEFPGLVVVRNRTGRWTAVFSFAVHGVQPAHLGFMTLN